MQHGKILIVLILMAFGATALCGCADASKFSSNAVQYNEQAELAQDQVILLNVLRASYRRPFEFSGVQTITGTASDEGQVALSIPLAQHGSMTPTTISPTLSRTAGPSVTVGVIDTQDFYEGLLTPVSMKLVDLYVQRNLPKMMLFDLFISRIRVKQHDKTVAELANSVGSRTKFEAFQTLLKDLVVNEHLTTDEPDKPDSFGPLLTAEELIRQPDYGAKAAAAGLEVKAQTWCDLSSAEILPLAQRLHRHVNPQRLKDKCKILKDVAPSSSDDNVAKTNAEQAIQSLLLAARVPLTLYRTQKAKTGYRFCFGLPKLGGDVATCETSGSALFVGPSVLNATSALCQLLKADGANGAIDCGQPVEFSFVMRSTYGIIYYLGEVVRQTLRPDLYSGAAYSPQTYVGANAEHAVDLFRLDAVDDTQASGRFLSVPYDGEIYAVPKPDASQTTEILDLVAELIALNKSAKDLPTTSVITAVGAP